MAKQVILGSDLGKDALKVKCNVNFTELYNFIGTLTSLSTEDKTNLVAAINEHEAQINSLDADKANKAQEAFVLATLINGWSGNFFYRKTQIGQLEIQYSITAGTVADYTTILTLPLGYRPGGHTAIPIYNNSTGESIIGLVLLASGEFKIRVPASDKIIAGQSISGTAIFVI